MNLKLDREHTTAALGFARLQVSPTLRATIAWQVSSWPPWRRWAAPPWTCAASPGTCRCFTSAEFGFVALGAVHHRQFDHAEQAQSRRNRTDARHHASVAAAAPRSNSCCRCRPATIATCRAARAPSSTALAVVWRRWNCCRRCWPPGMARGPPARGDRFGHVRHRCGGGGRRRGVPFREAYQAAAAATDSAGHGRTPKPAWPRGCRRARPPTCA